MADQSPIRVILFTSGAVLEHGVKEFIYRLEKEPQIEFMGAFCQSEGRGLLYVIRDLWQRRRFLAFPLLAAFIGSSAAPYLTHPRAEIALNRTLKQVQNRINYVSNIHADEVLARVRKLEPDLGLIYGSPILKPELFEIPRKGTLGIHHGKLPAYRGKKTTFWAMYNGEKTVGLTIQKVNAGLDTGEIVQEGEVIIGRGSRRSVWHELEKLGLDRYIQAILEVKAGTAVFKPFPGKKGKLYRDPRFGDLLRFWLRRAIS